MYKRQGLADPFQTAIRFNGFLDGSGGIVNVNNSADSNSGGPWLAKSVEAWFSVDDADTDTEQVIYEQGGSTRGLAIYVREGRVYAGLHNAAADGGTAGPWPTGVLGDNELVYVSTPIESNTPYHLAFTFEGADAFDDDFILDGRITGYLNGVEFQTVEGGVDEASNGDLVNIGTFYAHTDGIGIGGVVAQTHFDVDHSGDTPFGDDGALLGFSDAREPYYFQGIIDDVALYNTTLSAAQVQAHYDSRDYIQGDFDGNGEVEFADFLILTNNFNVPGSYSQGDVSLNGQIDLEDFSIFRRIIGGANPANAAVVPEPSSSLLLLLAALALPLFRRSRTR